MSCLPRYGKFYEHLVFWITRIAKIHRNRSKDVSNISKAPNRDLHFLQRQFRIAFHDRGVCQHHAIFQEDRFTQQKNDISIVTRANDATGGRAHIQKTAQENVGVQDDTEKR